MVARTWSYSCVHFFSLFFPFCLSLVCQTPSELHAQTLSVKLTHMLKDVFICLPVALERVCMYARGCMCGMKAAIAAEWAVFFLATLPACRVHCSLKNLSSFDSKAPQVTLTCTWWEKTTTTTKTMWGITVLVEEDAGVVFWLLPSSEYLVISN